jgi:hypothetical protein
MYCELNKPYSEITLVQMTLLSGMFRMSVPVASQADSGARCISASLAWFTFPLSRVYMVLSAATAAVKLIPLSQPLLRARMDANKNPSAQRATQLRSVLARVYAISRQNQIITTVP